MSSAAGAPASSAQFFLAHRAFVESIARRIVGTDLADDATQEVFFRVLRTSAPYEGRAAVRTWLYRVTTNVCVNMWRSETRRLTRHVALDEVCLYARPVPPASDYAYITSAISVLREDLRTVFVMYEMEGYRHYEIAKHLDIALSTSRARLFHARRALRRAIAAQSLSEVE